MGTELRLEGLTKVIDLDGNPDIFRRDSDRILHQLHSQISRVFSPRDILNTVVQRLSERGYVGTRIWAKDGLRYKLVMGTDFPPELLEREPSFYPVGNFLENILHSGKLHYFYDVTKVPPLFTGEFDPLEKILEKDSRAVGMLVVPYEAHSLNPGLQDFQGLLVVNVNTNNSGNIGLHRAKGKVELNFRELTFLDQISKVVAEKVIRIMEYNRQTRTGLYDANKLDRDLRRYQQDYQLTSKEYVFGIVDLDNFKRVNSEWGYLVGNQIIDGLGNILRNMDQKGIRFYHQGGDEFSFISRGDVNLAINVAKQVSLSVSQLISDVGLPSSITAPSVGIAMVSSQMPDSKEWYSCANKALNQAKSLGKDQFAVYGA